MLHLEAYPGKTMSTMEALKLQLECALLEKERLAVQNTRLREEHVEHATLLDTEAELARCCEDNEWLEAGLEQMKQLYEQLLRDAQTRGTVEGGEYSRADVTDLRQQLDRQSASAREWEDKYTQLEKEFERLRSTAELECHRACAREREKCEAREERLVEQLKGLQRGVGVAAASPRGEPEEEPTGNPITQLYQPETNPEVRAVGGMSLPHVGVSPGAESGSWVSAALLAQQLPPLTKFNGENCDGEGETFQDWIEQFEMVATVCHWDDQTKLMNLVTRLRGQAYAFFRSCTPQQCMNYHSLTTELGKRFTPVRIQVVQTSLFHDRRQGLTESVDDFAQDLRSLFYKAYPWAQQGTLEVVGMGQSVLANQFVSGLRADIKAKVAGSEGGFDQLFAKARFEEAKMRDLSGCDSRTTVTPSPSSVSNSLQSAQSQPKQGGAKDSKLVSKSSQSNSPKCYTCGSTAHLAKRCPARKGFSPAETPDRGVDLGAVARLQTLLLTMKALKNILLSVSVAWHVVAGGH